MNLTQIKNTYVYLIFLILKLLVLFGCTSNTFIDETQLNKKIYIKDNFYLIYKGKDEDGCKYFLPYSKNKKIINAIYFISKKNKYTLDKSKADCDN